MNKPKLIRYNDARHYLMYRYDPPMSLHQLRQPVDEILGTGVDTLSFGLASGHTFLHDSKVGIKWGENVEDHKHGIMWWRAGENLKKALEAGHDPLQVVIDRAHEKGIQVMCSLRINEGSAPDGSNVYMVGKLKYEKPEVMIGEANGAKPSDAFAYDFARAEVIEERLAVIEEVIDRYGADGLEIDDYVRVFFKHNEVEKNTPRLTDFMREVRNLLDRIGKKRGQSLILSARVHPVEAANLSIGMDVRTWLSEKLVNFVIPSSGGPETGSMDTNPYAEWLIEAAHQAGAWVYSNIGGAPYDDRCHLATIEMYRASASTYLATGFDGLYLHDLPWPHTATEYNIMREMGDSDIYARQSKHYSLGPKSPKEDQYTLTRHLPVTLEEGVTIRVPIYVGDALNAARSDGELECVILGVRVVQTGTDDKLSFCLNDRDLSLDTAKISTFYGGIVSYTAYRSGLPERINTHYWFEFELPIDLVKEGANELQVTADSILKERREQRVLQSVELRIEYKRPPIPVQGQM